jgi:hypothetical protein
VIAGDSIRLSYAPTVVKQLATRIERLSAPGNHFGSRRDLSGDDEITCLRQFHDASVGHVHAGWDQQAFNELGRGRTQRLVGDQCHLGLCPLRGADQQFLDLAGAGVRVARIYMVLFLCHDSHFFVVNRNIAFPIASPIR